MLCKSTVAYILSDYIRTWRLKVEHNISKTNVLEWNGTSFILGLEPWAAFACGAVTWFSDVRTFCVASQQRCSATRYVVTHFRNSVEVSIIGSEALSLPELGKLLETKRSYSTKRTTALTSASENTDWKERVKYSLQKLDMQEWEAINEVVLCSQRHSKTNKQTNKQRLYSVKYPYWILWLLTLPGY